MAWERVYHKEELDSERARALSAEKDKLLYRNLLLDATCGRFIRHGLEVFLSFRKGNSDVKQLSKEAREIMQSLKTFLHERTNNIFSVATQLNSLYRKYAFIIAAPQSDDAKAWTGQVKSAYNTLNRISLITIPQYEAVSPNITELMLEFRTASSETEAVEIFKKQCGKCYWSKIVTYLFGDNTEIGRLALMMPVAERMKLTEEQPKWGKLKEPEQKYANSLLVNGVHMVTGTSRYMDCVEVFYFGSNLRLKYPRSQLNKRWPHEDYETQVQLFCDIYAALYDVISQCDINAPPKIPGLNCTMDPTDMKRYFKSINLPNDYMDEFVFVTKLAVSSLN